ncbi:VWA domain-containing protein [Flexithrix dorotheae]|uniref:VWA domain-containing protein n=1 Tax=Flexithrix dorotheae TaxID=70993 RepID=UPI00035DA745|nr:VWA domain-containing protein [Flexithrix dorotheae]
MPENFEIAYIWMFYFLPLPLLIILVWPAVRHRKTALFSPFFQQAVAVTGKKPGKGVRGAKRNWFRWLVLWVIWILLLAALSSPQLVGEPDKVIKTTRNFLIAADLSFSMAEKDWVIEGEKATRWEAVKSVMKEFIVEREGDKMGLILFGANAYLQAPFTTDLELVSDLLEDADVGMAGQQTNIGKAIGKSIELFDRDTLPTKVLLLLTDGVDSGSELLPLDAANLAKNDSIVIYTIGIGNPGTANSDLDEQTLLDIAALTDGKYFRAIDAEDLKNIYAELDKLEPVEYEEEIYKPVTLLYYYPLGLAFGISIIYMLFAGIFSLLFHPKDVDYGLE